MAHTYPYFGHNHFKVAVIDHVFQISIYIGLITEIYIYILV